MSRDISVRVLRAGVQVPGLTDVSMQEDNLSQQEAAYYGGAGPYFRYMLYPTGIYDIQFQDHLIDNNNTDPKTPSGYREYRVINEPEPFHDSHMEVVADRVRGK